MAIEDQSISIVGCGPGSLDYLTPATLRAVEEAEVLVGAKRLLDLFPASPADRVVRKCGNQRGAGSNCREGRSSADRSAGHRRSWALQSGKADNGAFRPHAVPAYSRVSSVQTAFAG